MTSTQSIMATHTVTNPTASMTSSIGGTNTTSVSGTEQRTQSESPTEDATVSRPTWTKETGTAEDTLTESIGTDTITDTGTISPGLISESESTSVSDGSTTPSDSATDEGTVSKSPSKDVTSSKSLSFSATYGTFTRSDNVSQTPDRSWTRRDTKSPSGDLTASDTYTPPKTRTRSISRDATASPTGSKTPVPTRSRSLVASASDTPSLSEENTMSLSQHNSTSVSLSVSLSHTEQDTASESISGEDTVTRTGGSSSGTHSATLIATPSGTFDGTASESTSGTVTVGTDSLSYEATSTKSRSTSLSQSNTLPATPTKTFTATPTISLPSINSETRYRVLPRSPKWQWEVGRRIHIILTAVPLDSKADNATLLEYNKPCIDPRTNMTHADSRPLQYSGNGQTQNWTIVPTATGTMRLCYYSAIASKVFSIAMPQNITFVPWLFPKTTQLVSNRHGVAVSLRFDVWGADAQFDRVKLVTFGQPCQELVPAQGLLPPISYDGRTMTVSSTLADVPAGDFTACYRGYPWTTDTAWARLNVGTVRTEVMLVTSAATSLRSGYPATFTIGGFGFSHRDLLYITNDTVHKCVRRGSGPERIVNRGSVIVPVPYPFQSTRFIVPRITFSGSLLICFRGNTSKEYTLAGTMNADPITPAYFMPNGTTDSWAKGSIMELTFTGAFIDSTYDSVWIVLDRGACELAGTNNSVKMAPFQPNRFNENRFRVTPKIASNYSVCYAANTTTVPVLLGVVEVTERFYLPDPVFSSGVQLNANFTLVLQGVGMNSSHPMLLTKVNVTSPTASCTWPNGAVQPVAVSMANNSATFLTNGSGYHVVCLYSALGAVMQSDVIPIFPDAPTSIEPRIVPVGETFSVTLTGGRGMDLTFGDSIYPCDIADAASFTGVSPRVARGSLAALGEVAMCFRTAVVAGVNATAVVTRIDQVLLVSPIARATVLTPATGVVGTTFNVSVSGQGLTSDDTLYVCNASDPDAHLKPNTTVFTIVQQGPQLWSVTAIVAGVFPLCYRYAVSPAFLPGPLRGAPSLRVDPAMTAVTPRQILASVATTITIAGLQMHRVRTIFVNLNGTGCTTANPFAIQFVRLNVTETTAEFRGAIPRRGNFEICYTGDSGTAYTAPLSLTVTAHLDSFALTQQSASQGSNGTEYYSNFPIAVTLRGGGLDYSADTFFAVLGAICNVNEKTQLVSLAPPQGATDTLSLTLIVPIEGRYSLCYRFGVDVATLFPNTQITVVNGLYYENRTLALRGPYTTITSVVEFSFTIGTRYATAWTALRTPSLSVANAVEEIPYGQIAFRARVFDRNGLLQYTLTLPYFTEVTTAACGLVPAAIVDSDDVHRFARSIILLYNYGTAQCEKVTDSSTAVSLARNTLTLVKTQQSLVTDPVLTLNAIAKVVTTQRDGAMRYDDSELLLTSTELTLQRPTSEITDALLDAHSGVVNILASSLLALSADSTVSDPAKGQTLSLGIVARMKLISSRHCDRERHATYNATLSVAALAAADQVISDAKTVTVYAGYGVTVQPTFRATSSAAACVMGSLFTANIFPQRLAVQSSRRQLQQTSPVSAPSIDAVLPAFNIPVLAYALPKSSGATPLSGTPTVTFLLEQTPMTRPPGLGGSGWYVETEFYKFVPDSATASSGEWVRDYDTVASVDSAAQVVTVTHNTSRTASVNSQSQPVTASNIVLISGRLFVKPIVLLPPDDDTDIPLAILVGCLAAIHLLLVFVGNLIDRYRDARHEPDFERLMQPENNITMHRYLYVGVRKPHDQIRTWLRGTTLFTFVFAAAFFSMLALINSPFGVGPGYNIPLGAIAAVTATPFGAITRIALRTQLWDYASGVAAALAVIAIAVSLPLVGIFVGAFIALGVGVGGFFLAVAVFKARWGFEIQPAPGPFPKAFGLGTHVLVEGGAIAYLMYLAIERGTPRKYHAHYDYWQVLVWALAFDMLIFEPAKNRLFLWLRAVVVSMQSEKAARLSGQTPQIAPTVTYAGKALPPPTPSSDASFDEYELDDPTGDLSFADVEPEPTGTRQASVAHLSEFESVGHDFEDDSSISVDVATAYTGSQDDLSEFDSVDEQGTYPEKVDNPYGVTLSDAGVTGHAFRNEQYRAGRGARSVTSTVAENPVSFEEISTDGDEIVSGDDE
jgi:hypothetical protein